MFKLKRFAFFLRILTCFVLSRTFGSIISDVALNSNGQIALSDLRKYEKVKIKIRKAGLDLNFLKNCQTLGVVPKFLSYNLPHSNSHDSYAIRKRLLKGAIRKRTSELSQLRKNLEQVDQKLRNGLGGVQYYIINRAVAANVDKFTQTTIKTHEKKLRNLTHNVTLPFTSEETIKNMSSYQLSDEETDILKNGLTFGIAPKKLNKTDIYASFEMISRVLTSDLKEEGTEREVHGHLAHLANNYYHSYRPSAGQLKKHKILDKLKKNNNIVILKPDKGNAVVILDRSVYIEQMKKLISDVSKFKKLKNDPTMTRQTNTQGLLRNLKKSGLFGTDDSDIAKNYKKVYPRGVQPARLYGLPKLHKMTDVDIYPNFRPIISSIGTHNYELAKYLNEILAPLIPSQYSCKDTFTFIEDLRIASDEVSDKYIVSYDVVSLFTNIPLHETIDLAADLIFKDRPSMKCSKEDLKKLFLQATSRTNFMFDGDHYDQIDGVAMGSPLGPTLANLFMGHHEKNWLDQFPRNKGTVIFYRRYIDDIFAVFNSADEANEFLEYLNARHSSIKFTCEHNESSTLPFLDVLINNSGGVSTSLYRKKTYTGLLTNFYSYTAKSYKIGLIKNLLHRAFEINSSWFSFHIEIKRVHKILQQNSFPKHLIDRVTKIFIEKAHRSSEDAPAVVSNDETPQVKRYFKLPYNGKYSSLVKKKLEEISQKYCNATMAKIVFVTHKVGHALSPKDPIPSKYLSCVVYKFQCGGCGASYIGETDRHYEVRKREHLETDTSSSIYRHIRSNVTCFDSSSSDCFSILDKANTDYAIRLKEGLHIMWEKPILNVQVKCEKIELPL